MVFQQRDGRHGQRLVVETNLDERAGGRLIDGKVVQRTRHARTRFVPIERQGEDFVDMLEIGDPWCPLTVRARLHRVNWVLRQDPKVRPQQVRSGMPEHVREIFKDQPGEPMRIPVPAADQDAINRVLEDLLRFKDDDEAKAVIYAIVEKTSGDKLAETLHCSDTHARKLMKRMLDRLAIDWNKRLGRPDANDIERAKKLIHRNVK